MIFGSKKKPSAPPDRRTLAAARQRAAAAEQSQVFKRSRTLSGSASNHVKDVTGSKGQLVSDRVRAHDLRAVRRRYATWLGLVVAGILAILFLLFNYTSQAQVYSSTQPNQVLANEKNYQELLQKYYATHPIDRVLFMLDSQALKRYLQTAAPEIRSFTLTPLRLGVSKLTLTFRQPVVGWELAGKKYYVDQDGVAFTDNHFKPPSVTVEDQSGLSPTKDAEVANQYFMSFLGRVVAEAKRSKLTVSRIILPADTIRQVNLRLEGRPYDIKMTIDRSAEAQVAELRAAVTSLEKKGARPKYLDVRVDGRVYYQ